MNSFRKQFICVATALSITSVPSLRADAVTDWNGYWEEAVFATAQGVPAQPRFGAILHAAIFDAVNGIARKYTPYRVTEKAPAGARKEAAAIQAAYTVLSALYPSHRSNLDAHLAESLDNIPGVQGNSESIRRGRAWGEYVANQILAWRSTDGWSTTPPAYMGSFDIGVWRSIAVPGNPDGTLAAVVAQLATLEPFAITTPEDFRPGPPYAPTLGEALATPKYAADLNEVKEVGRVNSSTRTQDQTDLARLWQAVGGVDLNRAVRSVVPEGNSLVENARLFALANFAMSDALMVSMESKFEYGLWRPHHAIRLADADGNPATEADPEWSGLILAPRFPEYISNHSALTGTFMHTVGQLLGDEHVFELSSPNYPNFTWTFGSFSEAADQVKEARIWAGIHFRTACEAGQAAGVEVADYVLNSYLRPLH